MSFIDEDSTVIDAFCLEPGVLECNVQLEQHHHVRASSNACHTFEVFPQECVTRARERGVGNISVRLTIQESARFSKYLIFNFLVGVCLLREQLGAEIIQIQNFITFITDQEVRVDDIAWKSLLDAFRVGSIRLI